MEFRNSGYSLSPTKNTTGKGGVANWPERTGLKEDSPFHLQKHDVGVISRSFGTGEGGNGMLCSHMAVGTHPKDENILVRTRGFCNLFFEQGDAGNSERHFVAMREGAIADAKNTSAHVNCRDQQTLLASLH
jgi:hypothetical protein